MSTDETLQALAAWVGDELSAEVVNVALIDGGRSRLICAVDVRAASGVLPLLVRKETGFGPHSGTRFTMAREAMVLRSLAGTGIPAPAIHAVAADGSALIMERLAGRAAMPEVAPQRQAVIESFATALAQLHALDVSRIPSGLRRAPSAAASSLFDLDDYEDSYRRLCVQHDIIDSAIDWLKRNASRIGGDTVMVHGDAGPGNFMHHEGRLTGLIDWEMSHFGDFHDDLAWLWFRINMLGQDRDADSWFGAYLRASGARVDGTSLVYFIVMVIFRCTVCCGVRQAHDPGHDDTRPAQLREMLSRALRDAARPRFEELPPLPALAG